MGFNSTHIRQNQADMGHGSYPRTDTVRLLIISDIHSNLEALEACLRTAGEWDLAVNLGDAVGYGADPNAVIERVRPLGGIRVRGNHDHAVLDNKLQEGFNVIAAQAVQWARDVLTPENFDWLTELSAGPVVDARLPQTQFVHGSPANEDEYILSVSSARRILLASTIQLTFFGHTHFQGAMEYRDSEVRSIPPSYNVEPGVAERCDFPLEADARYLVNPGSVGQPRDGDWRAAFALYDSASCLVSFWRVPYEVKQAQQKILAAGLPQRLASRLSEGR